MNSPYFYILNADSKRGHGLTAEEYLLRQRGDWRGYIALMDSDAIEVTPFFRAIMNYYETGMKSFEKTKKSDDGILLALSVWGEDYTDRFLNFCLPSLLEEKNLAALKEKNARIFIHTNSDSRQKIVDAVSVQKLIENGIQIQMMMLNDNLLEMIKQNSNNKYWHLAMTQSLHLQYAKALGLSYHCAMPDVVYPSGFFERLFALGQRFVAHSGLATNESIARDLERYRTGQVISIEADKMISLCLLHLHDRMKPYFVAESKKWPRGHLLVFEGKDTLHLMSPHQTIAYMDKDVIAGIPDRFFFTLDSELEKIAGNVPLYSPCKKDALALLEISGDVHAPKRVELENVEDFCNGFVQRIPETSLHRLFLHGMQYPLDRDMLGDRWYMEDDEIAVMKKEVGIALCGI